MQETLIVWDAKQTRILTILSFADYIRSPPAHPVLTICVPSEIRAGRDWPSPLTHTVIDHVHLSMIPVYQNGDLLRWDAWTGDEDIVMRLTPYFPPAHQARIKKNLNLTISSEGQIVHLRNPFLPTSASYQSGD